MKRCLAVFCRPPIPGRVKTRLALDVGNRTATSIYGLMLKNAAYQFSSVKAELKIFVSEEPGDVSLPWQNVALQQGSDLGERMDNAFSHLFAGGYEYVLLCGTDIPGLTSQIIAVYLEALGSHDMVIGPTHDGGYYSIGISRDAYDGAWVARMPWSTKAVFSNTITAARCLSIRPYIGPELMDLDTLDDAERIVRKYPGAFSDSLAAILAHRQLKEDHGDPQFQ